MLALGIGADEVELLNSQASYPVVLMTLLKLLSNNQLSLKRVLTIDR